MIDYLVSIANALSPFPNPDNPAGAGLDTDSAILEVAV